MSQPDRFHILGYVIDQYIHNGGTQTIEAAKQELLLRRGDFSLDSIQPESSEVTFRARRGGPKSTPITDNVVDYLSERNGKTLKVTEEDTGEGNIRLITIADSLAQNDRVVTLMVGSSLRRARRTGENPLINSFVYSISFGRRPASRPR